MNQSYSKDGKCLLNVFTSEEKVEHIGIQTGFLSGACLTTANGSCIFKSLLSNAQGLLHLWWQSFETFFFLK